MKIAFVGASGYANIGDDTYPLVFAEYFGDWEQVVFNSDLPAAMPEDIGMLVLGGGGILYNVGGVDPASESRHFQCMKFYMDWALGQGIPWGIVSCGFQFPPKPVAPPAVALRPWVPYLKAAGFITLRSPVCVGIAAELTCRTDIRFFPDLAYLYRPVDRKGPGQEDILTIVPAGLMNPRNAWVQHVIRLCQSMHYRVQWLGMGAKNDDGPHLEEAAKRYPDSAILERRGPGRAFEEIARSRMVLTGRYHGMVFARSARVPFLVPQDAPHKIMSEDWSADPAEATGHITTLRAHLAKVGVPCA